MLSILKGPYLQWPTGVAVTVMWETSCPASSQVTWWETEPVHSRTDGRMGTRPASERQAVAAGPACLHRLELSGLEPGRLYLYQVRSTLPTGETVESETHPLQAAAPPGTPFSFAVTSETGGYGDVEIDRRVFAQIRRFRPDFLLVVGDAVQNGSRYEDWDRYFFGPGRELLASTPFYLCLGNHEEHAAWFHRFTAYPEPGSYYAFDWGDAHFVALDSTALVEYRDGRPEAIQPFGPGCPQYEFLEADLAATAAAWKIAFFHYPPYVSGDYQVEQMRAVCPVLERFGVDLVFNSHTIVYERSHPLRNGRVDPDGGIVYVVAGGAGAMPEWLHPKRAWHTAQSLAVPHFVQVAVAASTLELHAFDEHGHLFDSLHLHR
ncbi:MAG: metallophosphoesterase family protein [Candidatus Latescibacterota bacterium]